MKRIMVHLLILFLFVFLNAPFLNVQAQDTKVDAMKMMPPMYDDGGALPFGQEDFYSVTLRGNGEAVIIGRLVFSNNENASQSMLSLRLPRINPQDVMAFQIIKDPVCVRYGSKPTNNPRIQIAPDYQDQSYCLEYRPVSFSEYGYGPAKYQKAKTKLDTDTLTIFLPNPIKANDAGSVLLYYRGFGYAKKNIWGAYEATVETPKTTDRVSKLVIGVSVDDELKLAGTKGQVNYRFTESMMAPAAKMAEGIAASNQYLDSYMYQIGQGQIVKTASNLASLDSYTVKARYAEKLWALYANQILIGLLVGLAGFAGLWFVVKWLMTKLNKSVKSSGSLHGVEVLVAIGLPFITSLLAVAFTVLLFLGQRILSQFVPYELTFLITIFSLLVSIGVYALLLFAPSVYIGMKKGVGWGMGTFGMTVFWLIVFGGVALIFLWFTASTQRDYPVPYMMKSVNMMGQDQSTPPSTGVSTNLESQQ